MEFTVPKFIEKEAKIIGPLTFKQFLCLVIPGATVFIRIKKIHPNGSCTGFCEGLRSITLAEIKWCKKEPDIDNTDYGVGVKYFESVY